MHVKCTDWKRCVASSLNVDGSFCALQTFLLPLTHYLPKVPPSAVPPPFSVAINVCACWSLTTDQPKLHTKRRDSQACLYLAQSTEKTALQACSREEFCSRAYSCRVVALSNAKHRVDWVHRFNITHCPRSAVLHSIVCVLLEQRARGASSTAASISELVTRKWQFAGLQAPAELTLIDGERRKREIVVVVMKTTSSEHAGPDTVHQNLLFVSEVGLKEPVHYPRNLPFFRLSRGEPNFSQGHCRARGHALSVDAPCQPSVGWACGWLVSAVFWSWVEKSSDFPDRFWNEKWNARAHSVRTHLQHFQSQH